MCQQTPSTATADDDIEDGLKNISPKECLLGLPAELLE
jgi:hypothetical protein